MNRTRDTFASPYDQYKDRVGQRITVLGAVARDEYDFEECGPMFRVQFEDGTIIYAWPEEIYAEPESDPGDLPAQIIEHAIRHLRDARDLLVAAGSTRSVDRVRAALKSAEGARRHADCKQARRRPASPTLAARGVVEEGGRGF